MVKTRRMWSCEQSRNSSMTSEPHCQDLMLARGSQNADRVSRPMPRARAHISGLAERHEMQMERIAALERQIAEVRLAVRPWPSDSRG